MAILSDDIEKFIKEMMSDGMSRLNRNELAEHFDCAPSQINYVIKTRFSPERGYLTESRRGGGGYIRVVRLNVDKEAAAAELISSRLNGGEITERESRAIASQLAELGIADMKQARLMIAATSDKAISLPEPLRDILRCSVLKSMITELLSDE